MRDNPDGVQLRLVRIDASGARDELSFTRLPVLIGRTRAADVQFDSPFLSRVQCQIDVAAEDGHRIVVRDLGSKNGTWLNGSSVSEAPLAPGDVITLADTRLVVESLESHDSDYTLPWLKSVAQRA